MEYIRIFFAIILLLMLSIGAVKSQSTSPPLAIDYELTSSKVDSMLSAWNNTDKPGVAVAVLSGGKVVYMSGLGMANLEYDVPVSPSTKFHVASVSKQFTAFSLLLLQEQGKLSLDDDIRTYIPEVPDFGHTITLRHLANHTSGLRDQWNLSLLMGVRPDDVITNEHILTMLSKQRELNFIPGEEYLYCNTGYSLLAEVIARVSNKSFAAFAKEHIFNPLQMTATMFLDDHEEVVKDRAYSYYSTDGNRYKKRVLSYANVGPTNLLTSIEDLTKWFINFEKPKIGSVDLFNQMKTKASLNSGETIESGLGLFVNNELEVTRIEHGGADAGFRAHVSTVPTEAFSVIVISNDARCDAKGLSDKISRLYLNLGNDLSKVQTQKTPPNFIKIPSKELQPYEGHYWNKEHGFTRKIYLKNDTLMHFRTENNESWLAPIGNDHFKVMDVPPNVIVTFRRENNEMVMTETVNDSQPKILHPFVPKPYTEKDWLTYQGDYYSEEIETTYTISWNGEDQLIAHHIRMGDIGLSQVKHNFFLGDKGFFRNVEFLRDEQEKVIGFRVTNGRVRNLLFKKASAGR